MIWIFSILGDRAANVDITWYHWPCNIDITKNRFYMAARIDKIVISELAATDPRIVEGCHREFRKIWLGFVSHDVEVHGFIFKGHSWKV